MEIVIVKIITLYFFIATVILLNLLFNVRIVMGKYDDKKQEIIPSPNWFKLLFSLFWIITIPLLILKIKRSKRLWEKNGKN